MNIQGSMKRRSPLAFMLLLSMAILQAHGQITPESFALSSNDKLKEVNVELASESPEVVDHPGAKGRTEEFGVVYTQNNNYKWKKEDVKLTDGKHFSGELLSITNDSLTMLTGYGSKKAQRRIGYSEISFVAIHKYGAGSTGAIVGGLAGGIIGVLIFYKPIPNDPLDISGVGALYGGGLGFLVGSVLGAGIASTNKKHSIDGDKEKFEQLLKKIAVQSSTAKILPKGNSGL